MQAQNTERPTLEWGWSDWRQWAEELIATHSPEQVADSLADFGQQVSDLRNGMLAEAVIIDAQVLSLSVRALGSGRRKIVTEQVQRMLRCGLWKGSPRCPVQIRAARERAEMRLVELEAKPQPVALPKRQRRTA